MKTLLISRHGKTISDEGQLTDFDRYLTSRGKKDPDLISKELIELGISPDKIITSPAIRAVQTAEIFANRFQIPKSNIAVAEFLYGHYSTNKLIEYLQAYAFKFPCVQLVGHNPKMEELVADLTGSVYRRIPTSGTIVLEFEVNKWEHISEGMGTLLHYIAPKPLRS